MTNIEKMIELLTPILSAEFNGYNNEQVHEGDLCTIAGEVGVDYWGYSSEFSKRCKKHWVISWMCTDTVVGLALYSLDGEFVAVSRQLGRKCDEYIEFLSDDLKRKTCDVVRQYIDDEDEYSPPNITIIDKFVEGTSI